MSLATGIIVMGMASLCFYIAMRGDELKTYENVYGSLAKVQAFLQDAFARVSQ